MKDALCGHLLQSPKCAFKLTNAIFCATMGAGAIDDHIDEPASGARPVSFDALTRKVIFHWRV
jgi:hypothetical protein